MDRLFLDIEHFVDSIELEVKRNKNTEVLAYNFYDGNEYYVHESQAIQGRNGAYLIADDNFAIELVNG